MGDYKKLSRIEGLRGSNNEPVIHNKDVKRFFKWSKVVGSDTESSPISNVSLAFGEPLCAISFGTRVKFYDYGLQTIAQTYTSAKDFVRHTTFRNDDKVAAISDDSGYIQFVALSLKTNLRRFQAHNASVYCTRFSNDRVHLLTTADDGTVKYWDAVSCQCLHQLTSHTDRVRTCCSVSQESNLWATGGYEGIVRLHDLRCETSQVLTIAHESPVENVSYCLADTCLVIAGGTVIKLWDIRHVRQEPNQQFEPHASTITSAIYSKANSCIISSSLDCTVRYTNFDCSPRHVYRFDSQVFSLESGNDERTVAIGTSSGQWTIRHNDSVGAVKPQEQQLHSQMQLKPRGIANAGMAATTAANVATTTMTGAAAATTLVIGHKSPKLTLLDRLVKTFQYQAALDLALTLGPEHVYNLVETLVMRGALGTAVKNKDEQTILPLLTFLNVHLSGQGVRNNTLLELLHATLDTNQWLENCDNDAILALLRKIPNRINLELHQHSLLLILQGTIQLVLRSGEIEAELEWQKKRRK